jgi:hypothetical protein
VSLPIERIYIPTIRRHDRQITFDSLPEQLRQRVIMVVEPSERHLHQYDCDYLELPEEIVGSWTQLARTMHFIHKHAGPIRYCIADDDLTIKRRNSKYWTGRSNMEKTSRNATPDEILTAFDTFSTWLDEMNIGVVGLSTAEAPPPSAEYVDTVGTFGIIFVDGRMLSPELDDMDIASIRVAMDVLFVFECLSRGINTRLSTEWMYDNGSLRADMQASRVVWTDMYAEQPKDHFQTAEHYEALEYVRAKFPHAMTIYEKNGKQKNTKHWKKAYRPSARHINRYLEEQRSIT